MRRLTKKMMCLSLALAIITLTVLTACSGEIDGKWVPKDSGAGGFSSVEFDKNNITINGVTEAMTLAGAKVTYKISGSKLVVVMEMVGSSSEILSLDYKKEGESIFLNGIEYVREGDVSNVISSSVASEDTPISMEDANTDNIAVYAPEPSSSMVSQENTPASEPPAETSSVIETPPPPIEKDERILLGRDLPAYQFYSYEELINVSMGGQLHSNAIIFKDDGTSYANFNLDKQYATITGIFGHVDGSNEYDAIMNIYGDGKLMMTLDLRPNMFAEDISLDVLGVRQLKLEMPRIGGNHVQYAFTNMVLHKNDNAISPSQPTLINKDSIVLGRDLPAYQSYSYEELTSISMGGQLHSNAIIFKDDGTSYANFNLDKQYAIITGIFGHVDGSNEYDTIMNIYGDGKLMMTIDLRPNMFAEEISLDVLGVRQLKLEMPRVSGYHVQYAFTNMILQKSVDASNPINSVPIDRNALVLGTDVEAIDSYIYSEEAIVFMGGIKQVNALIFKDNGTSFATYNLDGHYSIISGIYGHVDGSNEYDAKVNIYGDDILLRSIDLKSNMFAEEISLEVQGVNALKIEMPRISGDHASYAFCNMVCE